jgi:hypothetical protein
MKTLDWLNNEIAVGNVCDEYTAIAKGAKSKKQLYALACDINSASFLCESRSLDIDVIASEFERYINGKCKETLATTEGVGSCYTSAIYCKHEGNVFVDTTLTTFLGCKGKVEIQDYASVFLFVDATSDLLIYCPQKTLAKIEVYNGGKVKVVGEGRFKIVNKKR